MTKMKLAQVATVALCALLGSGCLTVVAHDHYWARRDIRSKLAAEALAVEVAVGLIGGLAYSLDDDVTVGNCAGRDRGCTLAGCGRRPALR